MFNWIASDTWQYLELINFIDTLDRVKQQFLKTSNCVQTNNW